MWCTRALGWADPKRALKLGREVQVVPVSHDPGSSCRGVRKWEQGIVTKEGIIQKGTGVGNGTQPAGECGDSAWQALDSPHWEAGAGFANHRLRTTPRGVPTARHSGLPHTCDAGKAVRWGIPDYQVGMHREWGNGWGTDGTCHNLYTVCSVTRCCPPVFSCDSHNSPGKGILPILQMRKWRSREVLCSFFLFVE